MVSSETALIKVLQEIESLKNQVRKLEEIVSSHETEIDKLFLYKEDVKYYTMQDYMKLKRVGLADEEIIQLTTEANKLCTSLGYGTQKSLNGTTETFTEFILKQVFERCIEIYK